MLDISGFYVPLATKQGFNTSVTHIQNVLALLDNCSVKNNIADEITALLENKEMRKLRWQKLKDILERSCRSLYS